jgi:hypothetical protein
MDIWGIHMPTLAAAGVAGAGTFGSVYKVFKAFDSDQSEEQRHSARDLLLGFAVDEQKWQQFFRELFAKLFGSKHLSWKCARRSFALSTALIVAMSIIWDMQDDHLSVLIQDTFKIWLLTLAMTLVFGCAIDYFSLWKTRIILTKIKFYQNGFFLLLIVTGDFFATTFFYCMMYVVPLTVIFYAESGFILPTSLVFDYELSQIFSREDSFWLLYLVALLTSAWLWVYLIIAYGIRLVSHVPTLLKLLSRVQDFEEHPVRTTGYVVAAAMSAIVVILVVIWGNLAS